MEHHGVGPGFAPYPQLMTEADGGQALFVVQAIGLPLLFLFLMHLLEIAVEGWDWRLRVVRVAWDSTVLAIGGLGGLMADPKAKPFYGVWTNTFFVVAFALTLAAAIGIIILRRGEGPMSGRKAVVVVALGGGALVLTGYAALHH